MRRRSNGFTLIELMMVVAIVGILVAIAYPSYARYVEQARRADGKSALMDAAQRLERCHTQTNTYVDCDFPNTSPDGFYAIAATQQLAMAFTLTATPQNAQAGDTRCGTYTLQSNGTRVASGSLGTDRCW
jgi:type IV pilus assembly protein PilE